VDLKATDIRDIALTGLATTAAALLAPSLPMVGIPLGALATGWLSYKYGARAGIVTAVIATAAVTALSAAVVPSASASAIFTLPALLAAGPGTVWALKRYSATSVATALVGVLFAAVVASMWAQAAMMHTTVIARYLAEANVMADAFARVFASQDVSATAAFNARLAPLLKERAMLWPSDAFLTAVLVAALAVPVVSLLGRRMGASVASLPPLADLDLSFHLVWPTIAGLALLAADALGSGDRGWAWATGMNLLAIARPALFVQGLAAFAALYRRVGVGLFGRLVGFALLALSELVVPSVSVVGVADLFFNLRKLPRDGTGVVPGRV
jgi:hypothetical protein